MQERTHSAAQRSSVRAPQSTPCWLARAAGMLLALPPPHAGPSSDVARASALCIISSASTQHVPLFALHRLTTARAPRTDCARSTMPTVRALRMSCARSIMRQRYALVPPRRRRHSLSHNHRRPRVAAEVPCDVPLCSRRCAISFFARCAFSATDGGPKRRAGPSTSLARRAFSAT